MPYTQYTNCLSCPSGKYFKFDLIAGMLHTSTRFLNSICVLSRRCLIVSLIIHILSEQVNTSPQRDREAVALVRRDTIRLGASPTVWLVRPASTNLLQVKEAAAHVGQGITLRWPLQIVWHAQLGSISLQKDKQDVMDALRANLKG